jgi:hypothetical protein
VTIPKLAKRPSKATGVRRQLVGEQLGDENQEESPMIPVKPSAHEADHDAITRALLPALRASPYARIKIDTDVEQLTSSA